MVPLNSRHAIIAQESGLCTTSMQEAVGAGLLGASEAPALPRCVWRMGPAPGSLDWTPYSHKGLFIRV